MALDMESEFYKLAKDILSRPKNLYKLTALGPKTSRVTVMGADGFVMVGKSVLESFTKGPEEKAYRTGKRCGREVFGSLIREFDEEIENLPPRKLLELGMLLSSTLGWGDMKVAKLDEKAGRIVIECERTIELGYRNSRHHRLTCGFLTGLSSVGLKREMEGQVLGASEKSVTFVVEAA
ncbi:MAG: hypothetical protein ACMUIE_07295 [Thermoplasmatota archaeon]